MPDAVQEVHGKDRLVGRTIRRDNLRDYLAAAHYINDNKFDVVLLQVGGLLGVGVGGCWGWGWVGG